MTLSRHIEMVHTLVFSCVMMMVLLFWPTQWVSLLWVNELCASLVYFMYCNGCKLCTLTTSILLV